MSRRSLQLHLDRGALLVLITILIVAISSPTAGAVIDATDRTQQQTELPDTTMNNSTDGNTLEDDTEAEAETNTTNTTTTTSATNAAPSEVQFAFPNQTTNGEAVEVVAPRLPSGGFLVIHDQSYPQNGLGSTIGVSEYIPADSSYQRVEVRLFDVPGRSFDQSELRTATTLYAQAALDTNGNQQFDYLTTGGAQDVGYLANGTTPAVLAAQITVEQPVSTAQPAAEYGIGTEATGSGAESGNESGASGQSPSASDGVSSDGNSSSGGEPPDSISLNENVNETGISPGGIADQLTNSGLMPLLVLAIGLGALLYNRVR